MRLLFSLLISPHHHRHFVNVKMSDNGITKESENIRISAVDAITTPTQPYYQNFPFFLPFTIFFYFCFYLSIYLFIYIHSHLAFYPLQLITSPTDSKGHLFHVCVCFIYSRIFFSVVLYNSECFFLLLLLLHIFQKTVNCLFLIPHSSHLMMIQADMFVCIILYGPRRLYTQ